MGIVMGGALSLAYPVVGAESPSISHPTIYFESDSTDVVAGDRDKLAGNVAWLEHHPEAVVILEGHCDQTGSAAYNMELGDRRAREIKAHLIERGIAPERTIMVVSFGEGHPKTAGVSHAALQQNRRVEFILR